MTTLVIGGKKVKVSDGFMALSPEEQNRTVEEIAAQMGLGKSADTGGATAGAGAGEKPGAGQAGAMIPPMPMPENPELVTSGPGPTGAGLQTLYDQGILPRRYQEGPAPNDSVMDERTGMRLPKKVTAADGTVLFLNPNNSTYSSEEMMAEGMKPSAGRAFQAGAAQGFTLGWGDEIASTLMGERQGAMARAEIAAAKRDRPGMTLTGEVAGAVALPLPGPKGASTIKEAVATGAKMGAKVGAAYGAGTAEGGIVDRIGAGLEGAVAGAIFGAAAPAAINFGTKAFRRVFKASAERPTLESLKSAKTVAYDAVDKAGERFGPGDLAEVVRKAADDLAEIDYLPEADTVTTGMLKKLETLAGRELTLGQLDKFRRATWERFNTSKEPGLLSIIDAIDDTIAGRASTSALLDAARLANARFKKAELLDLAFQKASDQTAATGSGGNILNKMRQAVTSIINNPKQAKWFSKAEIDAMRGFIEGTPTQNVLRQIGKLAPSGNGLMTALNLGAVSVNPAMLAVSAAASGAKAVADRGTQQGAEKLIGMVSGATPATLPFQPRTTPRSVNALAGPLAQEYGR